MSMNLDRYLQKPLEQEPETPARKFVPRKPLADALEAQRKPKPFDQSAADAFAKGVHWPVGWTVEQKLDKVAEALVDANPWRECDMSKRIAPCAGNAVIDIMLRAGTVYKCVVASVWAWGDYGCGAIVAWRFAESAS